MRHCQPSRSLPVHSPLCAALRLPSTVARPALKLVAVFVALTLFVTGCDSQVGGTDAEIVPLDGATPADLMPVDHIAPTSDEDAPGPAKSGGPTQVARADVPELAPDDSNDLVAPSATPGLSFDLALTSTAVWMSVQATAPPPAPVTGGGAIEQEQPAAAPVGAAQAAQAAVHGADDVQIGPAPGQQEAGHMPDRDVQSESYAALWDNPFVSVAGQDALSTFAIDVDTASYANVRRFLNGGMMPPPDAVRIEELVNYFDYEYPPPDASDTHPFSVLSDVVDAPWQPDHRLVHIALQGRPLDADQQLDRNLVFLIDVSGSMQDENKLPLVQQALHLLVEQLGDDDRLAIVVYAGSSGLVLPSTSGDDTETITAAIDSLAAGGSTNGGAGIHLAYDVAADAYVPGGVNRVILATDGDFNVGVTGHDELIKLIEREARRDISLTVLGFGMGNLNDATLEQLADHGNGNYGYIDTLGEAEKLLVREADATLVTIAKDVKIQVEFNPAAVHAYRLIGYENRALESRDFADDTKDAGEIGAGHSVTALYEVVLADQGEASEAAAVADVAPLRYQADGALSDDAASGELLMLSLRYKRPSATESTLLTYTVTDEGQSIADAHGDAGFAAAVAAFGMLLRESPYQGDASWDMVLDLARDRVGDDPYGYRQDFVQLVESARDLTSVTMGVGATGHGS